MFPDARPGTTKYRRCRSPWQLLQAGARTLVMLDINENDMYLAKLRYEQAYPDAQVHAAATARS